MRIQGIDHLAQVAFHNAVETVQGKTQAVVGEAVLREIIGAHALASVSAAHLAFALFGDLAALFFDQMVQQACTQTELSNLSFIDLSDANADVINICRQLDIAAVSVAFGPAMDV